MTQRDIVGLILSYLYAFGLLLATEAVGKRRGWPQFATRKIVHIGAGMWIWGILSLFDTWIYGLIPFATFIVLNYVFYRYQTFKAMDAGDTSPGTVYFAISITALFALLWRPDGPTDRGHIAAAAVMAMTWGDGMASLVGQSWGRRTYSVFRHRRSWEGTAAMLGLSLITVFLTLWLLPGSSLCPHGATAPLARVLAVTAVAGIVAALAEGLSPAGTDNLTVPLLTGAVIYALLG